EGEYTAGSTRPHHRVIFPSRRLHTRFKCDWSSDVCSSDLMYDPDQPGCLLLDVEMPGMTGPELQHELNLRGAIIPLIFISSHAGVPTAVDAMLHGAFDFLQKPVSHEILLARVRNALDYDAGNR